MKIKTITIGKEFKKGMPNFSNITASMYLTVELGEYEEADSQLYRQIWDTINREIQLQTEVGTDQSWMVNTKEFKNHYQTTIKTRKE